MKILVFDTETTGLPLKMYGKFKDPKEFIYYNNARIVQIAFLIIDDSKIGDNQSHTQEDNKLTDCMIIQKYSTLIKPDNFTITNSNIHGITTERAEKEGIPFQDFLAIFETFLETVSTIIAHNLEFDKNILLSECYRYSKTEIASKIIDKSAYCTMLEGQKKLKVPKYPKLSELYTCFYFKEWNQIHDALDDCIKCYECYIKLL